MQFNNFKTYCIGCLYPFQANAINQENKILLKKLEVSSGLAFPLSRRADGRFLKSAKQFSKSIEKTPIIFKKLKVVAQTFSKSMVKTSMESKAA